MGSLCGFLVYHLLWKPDVFGQHFRSTKIWIHPPRGLFRFDRGKIKWVCDLQKLIEMRKAIDCMVASHSIGVPQEFHLLCPVVFSGQYLLANLLDYTITPLASCLLNVLQSILPSWEYASFYQFFPSLLLIFLNFKLLGRIVSGRRLHETSFCSRFLWAYSLLCFLYYKRTFLNNIL